MSNSRLIKWFDQLLFGNLTPFSPPLELKNLILRMESERIPWSHIILNGGLTAFPYQIHGDLNSLVDYLEKQWVDKQPRFEPPNFKTRAVSKFWDQLQLLLARRFSEMPEPLPVPSKGDDEILKNILEPTTQYQTMRFNYESAQFWGQVARKFINLNRPEEASALPKNIDSDTSKHLMLLYDVTCKARGQYFDPLNMYLVPRYEYLNAVHWQTSQNLETFMQDRPTHALTLSVQTLVKKSLNDLLQGQKPSVLSQDSCPQLDALLHNIKKIHQEIEQVPHENAPPKLIDIFQRLLALCQRDNLWEKDVSKWIETEPASPSLLYLTEQIRILEREKRIFWKHSIENNSKFDAEPTKHIYPNGLYEEDTKKQNCQLF